MPSGATQAKRILDGAEAERRDLTLAPRRPQTSRCARLPHLPQFTAPLTPPLRAPLRRHYQRCRPQQPVLHQAMRPFVLEGALHTDFASSVGSIVPAAGSAGETPRVSLCPHWSACSICAAAVAPRRQSTGFSHCERISSSRSRRRIAGYTVPLGRPAISMMLKP
jgi:hypothetical protein